MANIQKRGKRSFRISYYDADGIRHFETFKGNTPEEAEAEAKRQLAIRLGEKAQGLPVSSKPNTVKFEELCADVVNDYIVNNRKSTDDIETRFRLHILPVFGKRKAAQITTSQLNAYIVRRKNEGAAVGSINRELEAIRHAFILARDGRKVLVMPKVPHLRENNVRTGFFSREEVDRLCSFLKEPYRSFVLFAFLTGWRYNEIRTLQWSNIDFAVGEVRLDAGTTKSGEARVFPFTAELRDVLLNLKTPTCAKSALTQGVVRTEGMPALTPYVFSINRRPIGAFRKTWARACHKAGLPVRLESVEFLARRGRDKGKRKVRTKIVALRIFHDLRRSAAREFQRKGYSEGQIMRLMGWKTRSVFDRYTLTTEAELREAVERLDGANLRAKSATEGSGKQ